MGHSESKTAAVDVSTGPIEYSITVHTGEKRHSGTDASVYVQLYGDKGVSAEHKLHHESKKDFKKGHVDTHIIVDSDIGNLWKVEIWKIDKTTDQIDCDWFVKRLEITLNLHPDLKKSKSKKNIKTSSSDSPSLTQTQETRTSFDYENNAESNSPEAQSPRARSPTTTSPPTQSPPPEANPNLKSSSGRRLYFAFPCFRWIQGRVEVWEGTSVLPQHETNPDRIRQRKDELERKKGMYQWKVQEGWPSFIKAKFADLPRDERWTDEKLDDFMSSKFKAGANFALEKVKEKFHNWKDFDDYKELFNLLPVPKLQKLWKQDETFGRLRIQGVNPVAIRRVTQFPIPKFGVTTEMVQDFIRPGSNLDSEMKANRLYYIEYSNFAEYSLEHFKEGRYISSPICLFYVNEKKLLVPIAIQLSTKIPYDPHLNPIFTPKDQDDPEWLLAKMCFANVDAVSHQLISHLLNTHLVSEPFLVALHRQFATCHPVYKLLLPHFKFQLAVNCRAREILIAPGGPVDDVMPLKIEYLWGHVSKGFKKWRFDRADFPTTLRDRDITENPDDLPGYYYRDDGLLLWEIIKSFVKEQLGIYYKHDRDVKDDVELQAWAAEIAEVGFSGLDNGWPDHFSHLDDLVQAVTTIIWTVSAQHASVNFQQFEHFGFIPANPGSLFIAPPGTEGVAWERGKITLQDIFKGLPPKIVCAKQIAISYVLSQFSSEDDMLGMYPETLFTDEKDMASIDHYKKQLSVLEHKIMERGEYIELSPKRIPNSTAV